MGPPSASAGRGATARRRRKRQRSFQGAGEAGRSAGSSVFPPLASRSQIVNGNGTSSIDELLGWPSLQGRFDLGRKAGYEVQAPAAGSGPSFSPSGDAPTGGDAGIFELRCMCAPGYVHIGYTWSLSTALQDQIKSIRAGQHSHRGMVALLQKYGGAHELLNLAVLRRLPIPDVINFREFEDLLASSATKELQKRRCDALNIILRRSTLCVWARTQIHLLHVCRMMGRIERFAAAVEVQRIIRGGIWRRRLGKSGHYDRILNLRRRKRRRVAARKISSWCDYFWRKRCIAKEQTLAAKALSAQVVEACRAFVTPNSESVSPAAVAGSQSVVRKDESLSPPKVRVKRSPRDASGSSHTMAPTIESAPRLNVFVTPQRLPASGSEAAKFRERPSRRGEMSKAENLLSVTSPGWVDDVPNLQSSLLPEGNVKEVHSASSPPRRHDTSRPPAEEGLPPSHSLDDGPRFSGAAIRIQSFWRGKVGRRSTLMRRRKLRDAKLRNEEAWRQQRLVPALRADVPWDERVLAEKKCWERESVAAAKLQRFMRIAAAVGATSRLRRDIIAKKQAAELLQRCGRGMLGRFTARQRAKELTAVSILQRVGRGWLDRRHVLHIREWNATVKIQRWNRAIASRRRAAAVREYRRQFLAANKLQQFFRHKMHHSIIVAQRVLAEWGACSACSGRRAKQFVIALDQALCDPCYEISRVALLGHRGPSWEAVPIALHRTRAGAAVIIQRVYRLYCGRVTLLQGKCILCHSLGVRCVCLHCRRSHAPLCLRCSAMAHSMRGLSSHLVLPFEIYVEQLAASSRIVQALVRYARKCKFWRIFTTLFRRMTLGATSLQMLWRGCRVRLLLSRADTILQYFLAAANSVGRYSETGSAYFLTCATTLSYLGSASVNLPPAVLQCGVKAVEEVEMTRAAGKLQQAWKDTWFRIQARQARISMIRERKRLAELLLRTQQAAALLIQRIWQGYRARTAGMRLKIGRALANECWREVALDAGSIARRNAAAFNEFLGTARISLSGIIDATAQRDTKLALSSLSQKGGPLLLGLEESLSIVPFGSPMSVRASTLMVQVVRVVDPLLQPGHLPPVVSLSIERRHANITPQEYFESPSHPPLADPGQHHHIFMVPLCDGMLHFRLHRVELNPHVVKDHRQRQRQLRLCGIAEGHPCDQEVLPLAHAMGLTSLTVLGEAILPMSSVLSRLGRSSYLEFPGGQQAHFLMGLELEEVSQARHFCRVAAEELLSCALLRLPHLIARVEVCLLAFDMLNGSWARCGKAPCLRILWDGDFVGEWPLPLAGEPRLLLPLDVEEVRQAPMGMSHELEIFLKSGDSVLCSTSLHERDMVVEGLQGIVRSICFSQWGMLRFTVKGQDLPWLTRAGDDVPQWITRLHFASAMSTKILRDACELIPQPRAEVTLLHLRSVGCHPGMENVLCTPIRGAYQGSEPPAGTFLQKPLYPHLELMSSCPAIGPFPANRGSQWDVNATTSSSSWRVFLSDAMRQAETVSVVLSLVFWVTDSERSPVLIGLVNLGLRELFLQSSDEGRLLSLPLTRPEDGHIDPDTTAMISIRRMDIPSAALRYMAAMPSPPNLMLEVIDAHIAQRGVSPRVEILVNGKLVGRTSMLRGTSHPVWTRQIFSVPLNLPSSDTRLPGEVESERCGSVRSWFASHAQAGESEPLILGIHLLNRETLIGEARVGAKLLQNLPLAYWPLSLENGEASVIGRVGLSIQMKFPEEVTVPEKTPLADDMHSSAFEESSEEEACQLDAHNLLSEGEPHSMEGTCSSSSLASHWTSALHKSRQGAEQCLDLARSLVEETNADGSDHLYAKVIKKLEHAWKKETERAIRAEHDSESGIGIPNAITSASASYTEQRSPPGNDARRKRRSKVVPAKCLSPKDGPGTGLTDSNRASLASEANEEVIDSLVTVAGPQMSNLVSENAVNIFSPPLPVAAPCLLIGVSGAIHLQRPRLVSARKGILARVLWEGIEVGLTSPALLDSSGCAEWQNDLFLLPILSAQRGMIGKDCPDQGKLIVEVFQGNHSYGKVELEGQDLIRQCIHVGVDSVDKESPLATSGILLSDCWPHVINDETCEALAAVPASYALDLRNQGRKGTGRLQLRLVVYEPGLSLAAQCQLELAKERLREQLEDVTGKDAVSQVLDNIAPAGVHIATGLARIMVEHRRHAFTPVLKPVLQVLQFRIQSVPNGGESKLHQSLTLAVRRLLAGTDESGEPSPGPLLFKSIPVRLRGCTTQGPVFRPAMSVWPAHISLTSDDVMEGSEARVRLELRGNEEALIAHRDLDPAALISLIGITKSLTFDIVPTLIDVYESVQATAVCHGIPPKAQPPALHVEIVECSSNLPSATKVSLLWGGKDVGRTGPQIAHTGMFDPDDRHFDLPLSPEPFDPKLLNLLVSNYSDSTLLGSLTLEGIGDILPCLLESQALPSGQGVLYTLDPPSAGLISIRLSLGEMEAAILSQWKNRFFADTARPLLTLACPYAAGLQPMCSTLSGAPRAFVFWNNRLVLASDHMQPPPVLLDGAFEDILVSHPVWDADFLAPLDLRERDTESSLTIMVLAVRADLGRTAIRLRDLAIDSPLGRAKLEGAALTSFLEDASSSWSRQSGLSLKLAPSGIIAINLSGKGCDGESLEHQGGPRYVISMDIGEIMLHVQPAEAEPYMVCACFLGGSLVACTEVMLNGEWQETMKVPLPNLDHALPDIHFVVWQQGAGEFARGTLNLSVDTILTLKKKKKRLLPLSAREQGVIGELPLLLHFQEEKPFASKVSNLGLDLVLQDCGFALRLDALKFYERGFIRDGMVAAIIWRGCKISQVVLPSRSGGGMMYLDSKVYALASSTSETETGGLVIEISQPGQTPVAHCTVPRELLLRPPKLAVDYTLLKSASADSAGLIRLQLALIQGQPALKERLRRGGETASTSLSCALNFKDASYRGIQRIRMRIRKIWGPDFRTAQGDVFCRVEWQGRVASTLPVDKAGTIGKGVDLLLPLPWEKVTADSGPDCELNITLFSCHGTTSCESMFTIGSIRMKFMKDWLHETVAECTLSDNEAIPSESCRPEEMVANFGNEVEGGVVLTDCSISFGLRRERLLPMRKPPELRLKPHSSEILRLCVRIRSIRNYTFLGGISSTFYGLRLITDGRLHLHNHVRRRLPQCKHEGDIFFLDMPASDRKQCVLELFVSGTTPDGEIVDLGSAVLGWLHLSCLPVIHSNYASRPQFSPPSAALQQQVHLELSLLAAHSAPDGPQFRLSHGYEALLEMYLESSQAQEDYTIRLQPLSLWSTLDLLPGFHHGLGTFRLAGSRQRCPVLQIEWENEGGAGFKMDAGYLMRYRSDVGAECPEMSGGASIAPHLRRKWIWPENTSPVLLPIPQTLANQKVIIKALDAGPRTDAEHKSAVVIQRAVRRKFACELAAILRLEQDQHRSRMSASARIQAVARGYLARQKFQVRRANLRRRSTAALIIQSLHKIFQAKQLASQLRAEREAQIKRKQAALAAREPHLQLILAGLTFIHSPKSYVEVKWNGDFVGRADGLSAIETVDLPFTVPEGPWDANSRPWPDMILELRLLGGTKEDLVASLTFQTNEVLNMVDTLNEAQHVALHKWISLSLAQGSGITTPPPFGAANRLQLLAVGRIEDNAAPKILLQVTSRLMLPRSLQQYDEASSSATVALAAVNEIVRSAEAAVVRRNLGVWVCAARGLPKSDLLGRSDPYAVVRWDDTCVGQTAVVKRSLEPNWLRLSSGSAEEPYFLLPVPVSSNPRLVIEVFDWDAVGAHDFLGGCELSYDEVDALRRGTLAKARSQGRAAVNQAKAAAWFDLRDRDGASVRGSIALALYVDVEATREGRRKRIAAEAEEQRKLDEMMERLQHEREEAEAHAMYYEDVSVPAESPDEWIAFEAPDGEGTYWCSTSTGESTWTCPWPEDYYPLAVVEDASPPPLSFVNERGNRVFMIPRRGG